MRTKLIPLEIEHEPVKKVVRAEYLGVEVTKQLEIANILIRQYQGWSLRQPTLRNGEWAGTKDWHIVNKDGKRITGWSYESPLRTHRICELMSRPAQMEEVEAVIMKNFSFYSRSWVSPNHILITIDNLKVSCETDDALLVLTQTIAAALKLV